MYYGKSRIAHLFALARRKCGGALDKPNVIFGTLHAALKKIAIVLLRLKCRSDRSRTLTHIVAKEFYLSRMLQASLPWCAAAKQKDQSAMERLSYPSCAHSERPVPRMSGAMTVKCLASRGMTPRHAKDV